MASISRNPSSPSGPLSGSRSSGDQTNQTPSQARINTPSAAQVKVDGTSAQALELGVGDSGKQVQEAQQLLDEAGHAPGRMDGQFGPRTAAATQSFQQERIESLQATLDNGPPPAVRNTLATQINNLEAELEQGIVGEETFTQLENAERDVDLQRASEADLEPSNSAEVSIDLGTGSRSGEVISLQDDLDDAGFFPGIADGIFGPNTAAATTAFQQSRIDALELAIEGGLPPVISSQLQSRVNGLRTEQSQGIAGVETLAQLAQQLSVPVKNDAANNAGKVNAVNPKSGQLNVPNTNSLDSSIDYVLDGDIDAALENGLNSEGDSVTVDLGFSLNAPIAPGVVIGVDRALVADVKQVDGGYEVSIGDGLAASLGLEAESDVFGAGREFGADAKVTYRYESLDEAKQAVGDLAITAGNIPLAEHVTRAVGYAMEFSNGVSDQIGAFLESIPGVGRVLGNIDELADGLIERLPDSFTLPLPFGQQREIPLDGFKDQFTEIEQLRNNAAEMVGDLADAQSGAKDRLNAAYKGYEVSGNISDFANIGIPMPVQLENVGLTAGVGVAHKVTGTFNTDGTIAVEYNFGQSFSANGGAGYVGTVTGLNEFSDKFGLEDFDGMGFDTNANSGVTVTQNFVLDGSRLTQKGDAAVEFRADVELLSRDGVGATLNEGSGNELVYTTTFEKLGEHFGSAARLFVSGNIDGALSEIGSIEGDAEFTARVVDSASFSAGAGAGGVKLGVDGEIKFSDEGDPLSIDDLTLEDAFGFLTDQFENTVDRLQSSTN